MYFISAALVFAVKYLSKLFYKTEVYWITPREYIDWEHIRLVVVLNHTSLFEPLFISAIPDRQLWRAVHRLVVPVADSTMGRPLVGRLFKFLAPGAVAITRKRDESWTQFMDLTGGNSLILIFPEGRMKRTTGLDKYGHPMSVKGGVADILEKIHHGKMIIAYSGGLHHVQAPGDLYPRVFQTIGLGIEQVDIEDYKRQFKDGDFRRAVIQDLEEKMKIHIPEVETEHRH